MKMKMKMKKGNKYVLFLENENYKEQSSEQQKKLETNQIII